MRTVKRTLRFLFSKKNKPDMSDLLMPPQEAILELKRRALDMELREKVRTYLKNDIPKYLEKGPTIYAARYIASPNFETLRFIEMAVPFGLQTVITQDTRDIFVPQNDVKKALCKMPICIRLTHKEGKLFEHFQKVAVVDINVATRKPFSEIKTLWGESLIDFHTNLFPPGQKVVIQDDTAWIDRNGRGNLLELYKKFLALFIAHAVFFEDYTVDSEYERQFRTEVVRPAFDFVEEYFGLRPLIVQSLPKSEESSLYWLSYPESVLDTVREKMRLFAA